MSSMSLQLPDSIVLPKREWTLQQRRDEAVRTSFQNELERLGEAADVDQEGSPNNRTAGFSLYTPPAFALPSYKNKPKPEAIQVMEQYIQWHSVDALRRDPARNDGRRKFAVIFYSCPLQAGNRIHHFLTGLYWSIVTNRTVLYKYWDRDTCARYGGVAPWICRDANTESDCEATLARAPWIPSLRDWHVDLSFPEEPFFEASHIGPTGNATVVAGGVDEIYDGTASN
jgi:hypothetical protein